MPCRCDGAEDQDRAERIQELHRLTEFLCFACYQLEKEGYCFCDVNPAFHAWWVEHKEQDARRRADEEEGKRKARERARFHELRVATLQKLSLEERVALGLELIAIELGVK